MRRGRFELLLDCLEAAQNRGITHICYRANLAPRLAKALLRHLLHQDLVVYKTVQKRRKWYRTQKGHEVLRKYFEIKVALGGEIDESQIST